MDSHPEGIPARGDGTVKALILAVLIGLTQSASPVGEWTWTNGILTVTFVLAPTHADRAVTSETATGALVGWPRAARWSVVGDTLYLGAKGFPFRNYGDSMRVGAETYHRVGQLAAPEAP